MVIRFVTHFSYLSNYKKSFAENKFPFNNDQPQILNHRILKVNNATGLGCWKTDLWTCSTYYGRSDLNIVILLQYWKLAPQAHILRESEWRGGKKEVVSLKKFTFDRIYET